MEKWLSRVALVTGASSGIGASVCKQLVQQGLHVVGCARDVQRVQTLAEQLKSQACPGTLFAIKCDLTKENDITEMFCDIKKKFNRLDICVNNAGMAWDAPILTGQTKQWQQMFDVNVMALSICIREAWKLMKDSGIEHAHFVHINTSYTFGKAVGPSSHYYAASKQMVNSIVKSQIAELAFLKSKIRVSQISPGLVQTEFAQRKTDESSAQKLFEAVPSLQPEDVADAVIYVLKAPSHVNVDDIVLSPLYVR